MKMFIVMPKTELGTQSDLVFGEDGFLLGEKCIILYNVMYKLY
jgi:hypothetical protein